MLSNFEALGSIFSTKKFFKKLERLTRMRDQQTRQCAIFVNNEVELNDIVIYPQSYKSMYHGSVLVRGGGTDGNSLEQGEANDQGSRGTVTICVHILWKRGLHMY
jgi:hypothetical protein